MPPSRVVPVVALLVLTWPLALLAGQSNAVLRPIGSIDGKALYTAYCVQCHGITGRGDGPRAGSLKKPPADLTGIAARNDGKFSRERVAEYVLGIRPGGRMAVDRATGGIRFMTPDGPADMPAWDVVFRRFWPDEAPRVRAANLTRYLESIQAK